MTNTQQGDADWTVPLRALIASLRELETRFKEASETIRQIRPDEQIGDFPSLEGIETKGSGDLGVREVFCQLAVRVIEQRADELQAEADAAERVRAESRRQQNMSPIEAKVERLERALAYQGAELAKLRGAQQPPASQGTPTRPPQMLGLPGGMGRHPVGQTAGSGVRKIGTNGSASAPDTAGAGFTLKTHPLNAIGGSGRRG
jgi:hypothetical protein